MNNLLEIQKNRLNTYLNHLKLDNNIIEFFSELIDNIKTMKEFIDILNEIHLTTISYDLDTIESDVLLDSKLESIERDIRLKKISYLLLNTNEDIINIVNDFNMLYQDIHNSNERELAFN